MKNAQKVMITAILLIAVVFAFACKKDKEDPKGNSTMRVHLTDAPGDFDHVYIDIQGIEVHSNQGGWVTMTNFPAAVYDLLEFTNGMDTLLGNITLPPGEVSEMRLILGPNNDVMVDNVMYPLQTPSAMQSGLKFKIHQQILEGITYDVWIDFDAAQSIVETGNGDYILKPVIRAYTAPISGAIKGVVDPADARPHVYAFIGTDTFGTIADSLGHYLIGGVPAGSYTVNFNNTNGYLDTTINPVQVSTGVVTDMGTIGMKK